VTTSALLHRVEVDSVPLQERNEWRDDVIRGLRAGERIVTLFARRTLDGAVITAALQAQDRSLRLTRTLVASEEGYHALTREFPSVHCFEREMHEQTQIRVLDHPWLKPVRFEGREEGAMNEYPFHRIEGKEVHEVAVGPIHAGVIEPGSFRFMCLGEQVHHLEIHLGYQHRGVEHRLLDGDPLTLAPLVETIAGDTSVAHAWAYCASIEALSGCDVHVEVDVARAIALELERVAMHLATLSGLAADIGFLQGATTYGRLRTTAINTTMRLSGSRFGRGALRPGRIGIRMPPEVLKEVLAGIELLTGDLPIINDCFLASQTVRHRLRAVGVLTLAQATDLGVVGLAARASGIGLDARDRATAGAYAAVPIRPQVLPEGDCWARARLRIAEIDASLAWLSTILELYPRFSRPAEALKPLAPSHLVLAMVEGFRGEVVHCLETDETGRLLHYKVQDPSFRNWMGVAIAVRKNEISDFPICNKSFDLSYCGSDL
jgi:Ni,Fe-hydrogenase III large subunit